MNLFSHVESFFPGCVGSFGPVGRNTSHPESRIATAIVMTRKRFIIWAASNGSRLYLTTSNANPFKYSVSGIAGMIGWSGDWL